MAPARNRQPARECADGPEPDEYSGSALRKSLELREESLFGRRLHAAPFPVTLKTERWIRVSLLSIPSSKPQHQHLLLGATMTMGNFEGNGVHEETLLVSRQ